MATLTFNVADVTRCFRHAMGATEWSKGYGERGKPHPQLIFVHDDGLYLMSNGRPRDLDTTHSGPSEKSFVAYAKGYDPRKDDVWDKCRDAVGGDDFAEYLDLEGDVGKAILTGSAKTFTLKVTQTTIRISVTR